MNLSKKEALHLWVTRVMNRHARSTRRKGDRNTMTNAETTGKAAAVAEQGPTVATEKVASKKSARQRKEPSKGKKSRKAAAPQKSANATKKGAKPERKATAPRSESKGAKILEMIGRPTGATLAEIMKATDWQAHSVRGFISTTGKKQGVNIESTKNKSGERVYSIAK